MATKYAKKIDDFDDLVDPRTLARHFLGPKSSPFVLHAIEIEEKSEFSFEFSPSFPSSFFILYISPFCHAEMTTKFNQEMYARMKAKKNKPFSSLGKKVVQVVEKGTPVTLATYVVKATKTASPTPHPKRQRTLAKGKKKVGSQTSSV